MKRVPFSIILTIIVLSFYSLTALYVIGGDRFVIKQAIYITVGLLLLITISSIDFRLLKFYAIPLYIFNAILLLLVLVVGVAINSSRRWISVFGLFTIQPSEFAKVSLIIALAWIYYVKRDDVEKFILSTILLLPYMFIIFIQPDMGTSLVLAFIYFLILSFFVHYKYALSLVVLVLITIPFLPKVLKPYQMERILTFFDPYRDPLGSGYNVLQSIIAVGSGRLIGKGIANSTMTKLKFVPVQYADFIFSAISEIWGFVGVSIIILAYVYLLYFIVKAYSSTKNIFGKVIALGVFAMFFFQILINMGMNMGIMPVTGVPLPFLSFGGSSTIVNFVALALAISVYNFKDELNL